MNKEYYLGCVREFLKVNGVLENVIEQELSNITDILPLHLPSVCILKENRDTASKQSHIHVTGEGMYFFFNPTDLERNIDNLRNDSLEELTVFSKNILAMKTRAEETYYKTFFDSIVLSGELQDTYTYKKVGHASSSYQVQISKTRLDDKVFLLLRKCLFTKDILVFIKRKDRMRNLVVGIPSEFEENYYNTYTMTVYKTEEEFATTISDKEENASFNNQSIVHKGMRNVDYTSIARYTVNDEDETEIIQLTDLSTGINIRKKRTERHQDIVKMLALDLLREGYSLYEDPIDCYAQKEGKTSLLFEIKTLDGTKSDEKKQMLKALSQVLYYERFKAPSDDEIKKVIVFEQKISDEYIDFLEKLNISVVWIDDKMRFNGLVELY